LNGVFSHKLLSIAFSLNINAAPQVAVRTKTYFIMPQNGLLIPTTSLLHDEVIVGLCAATSAERLTG
jgi:hypothetical protein